MRGSTTQLYLYDRTGSGPQVGPYGKIYYQPLNRIAFTSEQEITYEAQKHLPSSEYLKIEYREKKMQNKWHYSVDCTEFKQQAAAATNTK